MDVPSVKRAVGKVKAKTSVDYSLTRREREIRRMDMIREIFVDGDIPERVTEHKV